jgi:hypothetical protein
MSVGQRVGMRQVVRHGRDIHVVGKVCNGRQVFLADAANTDIHLSDTPVKSGQYSIIFIQTGTRKHFQSGLEK